MTDEPAILQATYSDFKLIKTRKVISLSFEVPIELANQVYAVLGYPDPSKERWVAIAALKPETVAVINVPPSVKVTSVPDYGQYAKALKQQGFFRFKEVQEKVGTDKEFREWVQRQPSCISGQFDQPSPEGECTRNIAAHVRRAGEAGTGYKPPYSCVPLTNAEHQVQHNQGELASLKLSIVDVQSEQAAKDWFSLKAVHYAEKWAWETFKALYGYDSMSEVKPDFLRTWAEENGVAHLLPAKFKESV